MNKVLFIAPSYMDIYIDIMLEMEKQGYDVDYLQDKSFLADSHNIRGNQKLCRTQKQRFQFEKMLTHYWEHLLNSDRYNKVYDILFVLDGQSIRSVVFRILKDRNPNLYSVNYLFDTTTGVYEFQHNFHEFDRVFSFDRGDSATYNLNHLPIYWVQQRTKLEADIDIFGFGRYSKLRYDLFKIIDSIVSGKNKIVYLKLHTNIIRHMLFYKIKFAIHKVLGTVKGRPSPEAYLSKYNTNKSISPAEFRDFICRSKCVIDTSAPHQDGLTARFMWALGMEKKIVTTNQMVKNYDFYSPNQIFIVNSIPELISKKDEFLSFLECEDNYNFAIMKMITQYRIDNWVKTLLR